MFPWSRDNDADDADGPPAGFPAPEWPSYPHASPCDDTEAARDACDNPWCVDCDDPAAVAVDDGLYLHPYCTDCAVDALDDGGREYGLSALATYEGMWPTSTPTTTRVKRAGCIEYMMTDKPTGDADGPPAQDKSWIRAVNSRHQKSALYAPDEA